MEHFFFFFLHIISNKIKENLIYKKFIIMNITFNLVLKQCQMIKLVNAHPLKTHLRIGRLLFYELNDITLELSDFKIQN